MRRHPAEKKPQRPATRARGAGQPMHETIDETLERHRPSRYALTAFTTASARSWRYETLPRRCSSTAFEM